MGQVHEEATKAMNGVDVRKLQATIEEIGKDPDLASFTFHAVNQWVDGTRSKTIVEKYEGAKDTVTRAVPFEIASDEPEVLMGGDTAPNSIVSLLHALASCLSVTIVLNAAAKDIPIDGLAISMEGDLDLHGFFGLSTEVRPGFQDVRVSVDLRSEAPRAQIEELVSYAQKVSPILDSLRNRIPVEVELK